MIQFVVVTDRRTKNVLFVAIIFIISIIIFIDRIRIRTEHKIQKLNSVCKLTIVLLSLWGLMHKIYPASRY